MVSGVLALRLHNLFGELDASFLRDLNPSSSWSLCGVARRCTGKEKKRHIEHRGKRAAPRGRALGTRRLQTNAQGEPELDCQSLPFGDQQNCFPDPNAPASADDAAPLHFTGKERDQESGNDYFGAPDVWT